MKNLIKYIFCFLVVSVPLYFNFLPRDPFEINKIGIVYLSTAVVFIVWLIDVLKNKSLIIPKSGIILFASVYLFFNALSMIFSIHPYTSFFGNYWRMSDGTLSLINYFVLFIIAATTVASLEKEEKKRFIDTVLFSAVITSVIVSFIGILQYFNIDFFGLAADSSRIISTIGQPNFLGAFLLFSIPITFLCLVNAKKNLLRILFSAAIFINIIALVLTFSRSAWLGLMVLVVFLFVYYVKKLKKGRKVLLLFPLVILLSSIIFYKPVVSRLAFLNKSLFTQDNFNAENLLGRVLESRYYAWEGAIKITKDYPILGTGPETFLFSFPKYRDPRLDQTEIVWGTKFDKAHNDFLNIAANTGLFSLAAYLLMIVYMFLSVKKIKEDDWGKQYAVILSGAILAYLVSNLFGFPSVSTNLCFWIILGIIVALTSSENVFRLNTISRKRFYIFGIILIAIEVFLVISTIKSLKNYLADVSFNRGNYEAAVRFNPSLDFYHGNLALNYLAMNEKEKAVSEAKEAINANKNNADNQLVLIMVYESLVGNYSDLILVSYDNAITLEPNNPKLYFQEAQYLLRVNEKEKAIKLLEKALSLKYNYIEANDLLQNLLSTY